MRSRCAPGSSWWRPGTTSTSITTIASSKRTRLTSTMDALNQKYGTATLFPANMLLARAAVPTRIDFTSIPDLF